MFNLGSSRQLHGRQTRFERDRFLAFIIGFVLLTGSAEARLTEAASSADAAAANPATGELLRLGPEGHALAKRAGVWDVTFTSWVKPGAPPITLTGLVAERRMIGPMLQEILHTIPRAAGKPFTRVDDLTFNRLEGRWEYMSMDTRAPDGLMTAWSVDRDSEKRISINFQPFATPAALPNVVGEFLRMEEIIIRRDADHEVKDQYFIPADGFGSKWLAIRYSYTRRVSR